MNLASRHAPRLAIGVLVALLAAGYAWNSVSIQPEPRGFALIADLASSERFLTFCALPIWLVAAALATARASRPQRLVRHGSRMALLSAPLWRLLTGFAWMSAVTALVWFLLALGIAATARFADDWTTPRASLIRLRTGTSGRWVRGTLRREAAAAAAAVLAVAVVVLVVRYAATGVNPAQAPGEDLLLVVRVVLAAVLVIVVLTGVVVATGSAAASLAAAGVLLVAGAIPAAAVVGNPLTAWSAWWLGADAVTAALVCAGAVAVLLVGLLLFIHISKESKVHRVAH